ncbi:hypothetical protein [Scytonema sp. NUACC26]
MSTVQLEIPEEVLISLKETPQTIAKELQILQQSNYLNLANYHQGVPLN